MVLGSVSRVSQNQGYLFEGIYSKHFFNVWGSVWGSLYLWKLPSVMSPTAIFAAANTH